MRFVLVVSIAMSCVLSVVAQEAGGKEKELLISKKNISIILSYHPRGGDKRVRLEYYAEKIEKGKFPNSIDTLIGFASWSSVSTGLRELGDFKFRKPRRKLKLGLADLTWRGDNTWEIQVGNVVDSISDEELVAMVESLKKLQHVERK